MSFTRIEASSIDLGQAGQVRCFSHQSEVACQIHKGATLGGKESGVAEANAIIYIDATNLRCAEDRLGSIQVSLVPCTPKTRGAEGDGIPAAAI